MRPAWTSLAVLRIETVEMTLVVLLTAAAAIVSPILPARLAVGTLALVAASMLLAQGLLRDLWLLSRRRRSGGPSGGTASRCLCVESGVGVLAVLLGLVLTLGGLGGSVSLGRIGWPALVAAVFGAGFLLKDWVFEWHPWRLRREKDHANLVFTWRKR